MSADEFTKLFKYMEAFRADFDQHREESKKEHSEIIATIAELSAEVKDYHVELIPMSKKVDRLAEAVRQIAQETGVKLKFDF